MLFVRRWSRPLIAALAVAAGLGACGPPTNDAEPPRALATGPSAAPAPTASPPGTPRPSVAASPTRSKPAPRYAFPVVPVSRARFGRTHHDYPATDIFAACGDTYRAATAGRVIGVERSDQWRVSVNSGVTRGGLSVTLLGDDGVRYYGSHLGSVDPVIKVGLRVPVGQSLGKVGDTGSARGRGCHVHFGISPPCGSTDWFNRRGLLYPWAFLESWRANGQRSPVAAVSTYRKTNGCPTGPLAYP